MIKKLTLLITVLLVISTLSGCANRSTARIEPSTDFSSIRTMHVFQHAKDSREVNVLIADNLRRRGFSVTTGTDKPNNVDSIVTYNDRWMWDITMYLLELTVTIRDPKTEFPMATGNSMHTSLTRKSPPAMVDEVLSNIFDRKNK